MHSQGPTLELSLVLQLVNLFKSRNRVSDIISVWDIYLDAFFEGDFFSLRLLILPPC